MKSPYMATFLILFIGCQNKPVSDSSSNSYKVESAIRQIHSDYVKGWIEMDEEKVMNLLEENSMIQPNRLNPIEGKENIRAFWFPKDSSITTINKYETKIISLELIDSLAITTHTSLLEWNYQKDSTAFGMIQKRINTTVYRQQADESWKIWRSMWTDIEAKRKM